MKCVLFLSFLLLSCASHENQEYVFSPGAYEHTLEIKSENHDMKFWGVMIIQPNRSKKLIALTPLGTRLFELEMTDKERKFTSIDKALEEKKSFLLDVCATIEKEFDKKGELAYPEIETLSGKSVFYNYILHILKKGKIH